MDLVSLRAGCMQQVSAVPQHRTFCHTWLGRIFSLSCQKSLQCHLSQLWTMQKFHSPDSDQSCTGSALELLLMRPRNQCYEESTFGWLGIHSWTRNTNSNKQHSVPYSLFQCFAYSLKCFQGRSKAAAFCPFTVNSPGKSQQKDASLAKKCNLCYNKGKTKVHYRLWGECSGLSELTYLTGK